MTAKVVAFRPASGAAPTAENGNVPPIRVANKDRRPREYLTPREVDQLIEAARKVGRHGHRDATMILLAYRHGLRVSELVGLTWDQIDLADGLIHVHRLKNGRNVTQPLSGTEIRALRRLQREQEDSRHVFVSERKAPLTASAARKIVARAGEGAGLAFPVHPHMMRHAAGYYLANKGVDTRTIQQYLGHREIRHSVTYTELAPNRFNGLWHD